MQDSKIVPAANGGEAKYRTSRYDVLSCPMAMNIRILIYFAVFTSSQIVGSGALAATYVVDINDVKASDSNPGTTLSPWRTIQRAADAVSPGDTVVVKPGMYPERVKVIASHSGSEAQPIVFRADQQHKAILYGFDLRGAQYLRIEGFAITTLPITDMSVAAPVGQIGILPDSHTQIINNYFYDVTHFGIYGKNQADDVNVLNNRFYRCNAGIVASGKNWLVEGNEIERLVFYAVDADYVRFFGEHLVFRKNFFHGTLKSEKQDSHTDAFQTFRKNLDAPITRFVTIENNIIESFSQGIFTESDYPPGDGLSDFIIRNNVFLGGDIGGHCIRLTAVERAQVLNNVCAFTRTGIKFGSDAGLPYSSGVAIGNISFRATEDGYGVSADDPSKVLRQRNLIFPRDSRHTYDPTELVDVDPKFLDLKENTLSAVIGADGKPFTSDDGYRLSADSPAINSAGDLSAYGLTTDIFGTSRPQHGGFDMGAHEVAELLNQHTPLAPTNLAVR